MSKEKELNEKELKEKKPDFKEIKKRQIIIETDGNSIQIIKAEVAGSLEFKAILESLMNYVNNPQK